MLIKLGKREIKLTGPIEYPARKREIHGVKDVCLGSYSLLSTGILLVPSQGTV
uniref:Uncharacterized protein n=1 Tax=Physcomitrium patens TaxID=3218 RepID=A0A2K1L7X0_PHYPA|nr:hypothetical protein PHYPA_000572 [Physcomitrium patens]